MRISDWSSDVCSSDLEARVVTGAAGDDVNALHQRQDAARSRAERGFEHVIAEQPLGERVGQRPRLLVDFLEHVMRVFAALDGIGRQRRLMHRALDALIVDIPDRHTIMANLGRSEEPTPELQSLMRSTYAVFGLK